MVSHRRRQILNGEFLMVGLGGQGQWLTFGSLIVPRVMVVLGRLAWSFPYMNIDDEERMKFDNWVDRKWGRDRLENEEN